MSALTLPARISNTSNRDTTVDLDSELVEYKSDDVLEKSLGFDGDQLINPFGRAFGSRYLDDFQKSLALLCYQLALMVQERLSRHGFSVHSTMLNVQAGQ